MRLVLTRVDMTMDAAEVDRLIAAGASGLWSVDDHHVTLADPEGNEFCVA